MNEITLPYVLTQSDEYQSLTDIQARAFIARLMYVAEIAQKVEAWGSGVGQLPIAEFLDDLELDVAINLSVSNDPTSHPSTWLVRSSWTFQTSAEKMQEALPKSIRDELDASEPSAVCSSQEFATWVEKQGNTLKVLLALLSESRHLPDAIGNYIAMDVILAKLLVALCKARLNPGLYIEQR